MAKKVLFSVRRDGEGLKAIPVSNIKEFAIRNVSEWSSASKTEWLDYYNYGYYYVSVAYTICTGSHAIVFTADSESDCIDFINSIYE